MCLVWTACGNKEDVSFFPSARINTPLESGHIFCIVFTAEVGDRMGAIFTTRMEIIGRVGGGFAARTVVGSDKACGPQAFGVPEPIIYLLPCDTLGVQNYQRDLNSHPAEPSNPIP
jgi:hypothetical protein